MPAVFIRLQYFLVFENHPLDQREVLFLEAESGKIIEETFDSLIKSELAVHSLKQLKSKNLREVRPYLSMLFHVHVSFR